MLMNKESLIKELRSEGFSEKILRAFEIVKREDFIPESLQGQAYENIPIPIGKGQTISQPYTIAFMLQLLELEDNQRILEIGSGSGYVLALINELSKNSEIYGFERIKELYRRSKHILRNHKNIKIIYGDGTKNINEIKFDRILVSAAADKFPENLTKSLDKSGILVIPVRNSIIKIKKEEGKFKKYEYPGFVFVPLINDKE